MEICKELRASREQQGISRKLLAERVGRSPISIARYELGLEEPPLRVLQAIAQELGYRVSVSLVGINNKGNGN